jgi:hypothetical protein
LGATFDPDSNPKIYIDGEEQTVWTNHTITTVTPGTEVNLLENVYVLDVPSEASKFLKYTSEDNNAFGVFLDSNNQPASIAYMLYQTYDNYVEFDVIDGGGPK